MAARPWPIALLCFILTISNPITLAIVASSSLIDYGASSFLRIFILAGRMIVTSIGIAAGRALWLRRPGAARFAQAALLMLALEAVVRYSTRVDLGAAPPGTRLPRASLVVAHNAAWILYLQKSRRVQQAYGLESQPYKE